MDRGKLFLPDPLAGMCAIEISTDAELVEMQDSIFKATGVLEKDIMLGEFYDRYRQVCPERYTHKP